MEDHPPLDLPLLEEARKLRLFKHESRKCKILLYILLVTHPIITKDQLTFISTFSLMRDNYNSINTQISNLDLLQKADKINQKLLKLAARCLRHIEQGEDVIYFYVGLSSHPSY